MLVLLISTSLATELGVFAESGIAAYVPLDPPAVSLTMSSYIGIETLTRRDDGPDLGFRIGYGGFAPHGVIAPGGIAEFTAQFGRKDSGGFAEAGGGLIIHNTLGYGPTGVVSVGVRHLHHHIALDAGVEEKVCWMLFPGGPANWVLQTSLALSVRYVPASR